MDALCSPYKKGGKIRKFFSYFPALFFCPILLAFIIMRQKKKIIGSAICRYKEIFKCFYIKIIFFQDSRYIILNACPKEIGKKTLNTLPAMNFFFIHFAKNQNGISSIKRTKRTGSRLLLFYCYLLKSHL